jgi:hypothetical protein
MHGFGVGVRDSRTDRCFILCRNENVKTEGVASDLATPALYAQGGVEQIRKPSRVGILVVTERRRSID